MDHDDSSIHDSDDHVDWHDGIYHEGTFEYHDGSADALSHHDDHDSHYQEVSGHSIDWHLHFDMEGHHRVPHDHDPIGNMALGTTEVHYAHLDPTYAGSGVIGNPLPDLTNWHEQQHGDTCAVVAQEFVLNSFGLHLSENELQHEALVHGWYTPHGGTPLDHVGDLISYHGIPTEHHAGATMSELANALSQGQKVIVGINAEDIWYHGSPNDPLTSYPGIPGQSADHAVEVIGLDVRDSAHPQVILNDPGTRDGQGIEVPIATFEQAWATSDHFMMSTIYTHPSMNISPHTQYPSTPLLGDAQSDADQKAWDAKQEEWKASWTEWETKQEEWKTSWAEWEAKKS